MCGHLPLGDQPKNWRATVPSNGGHQPQDWAGKPLRFNSDGVFESCDAAYGMLEVSSRCSTVTCPRSVQC